MGAVQAEISVSLWLVKEVCNPVIARLFSKYRGCKILDHLLYRHEVSLCKSSDVLHKF